MNTKLWKWVGQVCSVWLCLGLGACPEDGDTRRSAAPQRVIVVGAGVSGLTAAHALAREGIEAIVLEARGRVGGRILTAEVDGAFVDLGAAWVHAPRGNPLAELVDAWELPHAPYEGDFQRVWDALHGVVDERELLWGYAQFELFSARLPALRKELGSRASVRDGVDTFVDAMAYDEHGARLVRFIIEEAVVENDYAAPPDELSLQYFLEDPTFSGSDWVLEGGYTKLVKRLAEPVDLRLGERVTCVEYGDFGVRVHGTSGVFAGSHVIVTVPLGVLKANAIAFEPALPEKKQEAIGRLAMGNLEKVVMRYDEAFWARDRGRIFAYLGEPLGTYPGFIDMTEFAGAPTLVAIYGGSFARAVQAGANDDQIREDALSVLAELLGQSLPEPRAVSVTRWTRDPFSLGSYSFVPAGASPVDRQTLAEPVAGRVLFAGEATSEYASTVHGAYLSGLREAQRLGARDEGLADAHGLR